MATKYDLQDWVYNALIAFGGRGSIVQIAKKIWNGHQSELKASGDLFYTWQYDMRWAATNMRKKGKMKAADKSPTGIWELA